MAIQAVSTYFRPAAIGSILVSATTTVAIELFKKIAYFANRPNLNRLIGVAISVIVCSLAISYTAAGIGAAAYLTAVVIQRCLIARQSPHRQAIIPREESVSLQIRIMNSLCEGNVKEFIRDAVRNEKPQFILQICSHLLNLPRFQDDRSRSQLAVYLQEQILTQIVRFNKPALVEELFIHHSDMRNQMAQSAHPLILDLVNLCAENVGDIFDGEGRFRVYAITDGTLINMLKGHADPRLQAMARYELNVSEDANAYLSNAIIEPSFTGPDIIALYVHLEFTAADKLAEVIPENERYN